MTVQEWLDIQRWLHYSRPDLRVGTHNWWVAMITERDRRVNHRCTIE